MDTRYDYGGDEFIFVDFDVEMSLEVNFRVLSVCQEIERQRIDGLIPRRRPLEAQAARRGRVPVDPCRGRGGHVPLQDVRAGVPAG
jgi:hypothetical protein